jgi:hypothetical protein
MSERLNGGPFTLGFGKVAYITYWFGSHGGDDRHLAYGCAHPLSDWGGNFVSFDQRSMRDEQDHYTYGFTVRNDATSGEVATPFDVYATTP